MTGETPSSCTTETTQHSILNSDFGLRKKKLKSWRGEARLGTLTGKNQLLNGFRGFVQFPHMSLVEITVSYAFTHPIRRIQPQKKRTAIRINTLLVVSGNERLFFWFQDVWNIVVRHFCWQKTADQKELWCGHEKQLSPAKDYLHGAQHSGIFAYVHVVFYSIFKIVRCVV